MLSIVFPSSAEKQESQGFLCIDNLPVSRCHLANKAELKYVHTYSTAEQDEGFGIVEVNNSVSIVLVVNRDNILGYFPGERVKAAFNVSDCL